MADNPPPQRLRDLVARPPPFPLRTVVLVVLVPLVAFTIFVIATHHERPLPSPSASSSTSTSSAESPHVIFVTPVSAPPAPAAKSAE